MGLRGLRGLLLFGVIVFVVYGQTLGDFFLSDELTFLHWARSATAQDLTNPWVIPRHGGSFWRPFPFLFAWGVEYFLFGESPAGYRLVNLLLHTANAALLAWVVRRLTGRAGPALLAGAVFALHPLHPGTVALIAAQFDLWAAFFSLLSLGTFIVYHQTRHTRVLWISCGALVLALLSKESALSLPLGLGLCWLVFFRSHGEWRSAFRWALPDAAILVGYLGLRLLLIGDLGGLRDPSGRPYYALRSVGNLLGGSTVSPFAALLWPLNPAIPLPVWLPPLILVLLSIPVMVFVVQSYFHRPTTMRLFLFGALLVPLLAIPASPMLPTSGFLGSRYLYLPSAAFALVAAAVVTPRWGQRRILAMMGLAPFLLAYLGLTLVNLGPWRTGAAIAYQVPAQMKALRPAFPPGARVFVRDIPLYYRGALVIGIGLNGALELFYHPKQFEAYSVGIDTIPERRGEPSGKDFYFRWDTERMRLTELDEGSN